jgi:hypothetical protein
MHSALLIVKNPSADPTVITSKWRQFVGTVENLKQQHTEIQEILEGVWQIDIHSNLRAFVDIVHAAQTILLDYQVMFFQDPPTWIHSAVSS